MNDEYDMNEVQRVFSLERRYYNDAEIEEMVNSITSKLKTSHGTMKLRPIQAMALYECYKKKGLFCPARVGAGKTIISVLIPTIMNSKKSILIIPAFLKNKTILELKNLRKDWKISTGLTIISYEKLARLNYSNFLENYKPDVIICDEAHYLKNKNNSATKRILRYLVKNPKTIFAALSGTIISKSILDYQHILNWSLREDKPIPSKYEEVKKWAKIIDYEKKMEEKDPKFFRNYFNSEEKKLYLEGKNLQAIRKVYQRRLTDTLGVVSTKENFVGSYIELDTIHVDYDQKIISAFKKLREDFVLPDGNPFADNLALLRHAKELALGFYYQADPLPPSEWLEVKKKWCQKCREVLLNNQFQIDTEAQLILYLLKGKIKTGLKEYEEWKKTQGTFELKTKAFWISEKPLQKIINWLDNNKKGSIIWCEHKAIGLALEKLLKVPFFYKNGMAQGYSLNTYPKDKPLILSVKSCGTGYNLQDYYKNLITSPSPQNKKWEQLMGRTHRDGQKKNTVLFDVLINCAENLINLQQAINNAKFTEDTTGQSQKLVYAHLKSEIELNQLNLFDARYIMK